MSEKVKVAVAGLGKMGLSHFAIINAHPDTEVVACDATGFLVDVLSRNIPNRLYRDYDEMLAKEDLDAVIVATPSRLHAGMVQKALDRDLHVFCEKPFCLDWREAEALADRAEAQGLVSQVGYHYRYVAAFGEMQRVVASGALGRITHVVAEAYGPVVLRPKRQTWRTQKAEGGGCLYDYAAHPLNLLNWFFGAPEEARGSQLVSVFSRDIDDQVMSTLTFPGGVQAQLSVNWSDEAHRKMTTKISMVGTNGRINADRQECQVYLRKPDPNLSGYGAGWTVRYTTDLTEEPWYYLRGEEYSAQVDDFIRAVQGGPAPLNDFRSAAATDRALAMIVEDAAAGPARPRVEAAGAAAKVAAPRRRWFARG